HLRRGAFEMRCQPRVDSLANPQQPLTERCESGTAPLLLGDQRLAHPLRPHCDQAPGLTVGQADLRRRHRTLARMLDALQEGEKVGIDRLSRLVPRRPDEVEVERRSYLGHMLQISY